jgi:hypothetical protein
MMMLNTQSYHMPCTLVHTSVCRLLGAPALHCTRPWTRWTTTLAANHRNRIRTEKQPHFVTNPWISVPGSGAHLHGEIPLVVSSAKQKRAGKPGLPRIEQPPCEDDFLFDTYALPGRFALAAGAAVNIQIRQKACACVCFASVGRPLLVLSR